MSKYVGQSEENIRALFADAEAEYKTRGDDSDLHIIIFDEIDAVCKVGLLTTCSSQCAGARHVVHHTVPSACGGTT